MIAVSSRFVFYCNLCLLPATPARFSPSWCLPSCPMGLRSEAAFSWWFGNGACCQVSCIGYIISIGVSCWKELPDWTPSLWSALTKSHHELPVLLVNKLTYPESTELHFHLCFSMFAGHTIVLYNWAGQLDALYTQAVFVVFFPSKTSNLLICLHSLDYISSQIMHTTLFLTLHFPLILKSNLSSECPGRQQRRKENISKGKRVTWTILKDI